MTQTALCFLAACMLVLYHENGWAASFHQDLYRFEKIADIPPLGSSIRDVKNILGPGKPLPRKEHQADRYCYRSPSIDDSTILIVEAGPTGAWKRVTGLWLYERPDDIRVLKGCTASEKISKNLAFEGGMKLGVSREEVRRILGPPQESKVSSWIYVEERRFGKGKTVVDVMSWLEFRFSGDRVSVIGSARTETN